MDAQATTAPPLTKYLLTLLVKNVSKSQSPFLTDIEIIQLKTLKESIDGKGTSPSLNLFNNYAKAIVSDWPGILAFLTSGQEGLDWICIAIY